MILKQNNQGIWRIVKDKDEEDYEEVHLKRKIDSVNAYREYNRLNKLEEIRHGLKNCCWICDGWAENDFKYIKGESGPENIEFDPSFIHFRHLNYEPIYVPLDDNATEFSVNVMCLLPVNKMVLNNFIKI